MTSPAASRWAPGSFLARLSADRVAELLAYGVSRQFGPGHMLLREGSQSDHVELLTRGYVKITNLADGIGVLIGIRMPGDLLGEHAGLTGLPRIASATTCGRVTATVISKRDFHRFLSQHSEVSLSMAASVAERLRWANERRTDFAAFPAEVRLTRLLIDIARRYGSPTSDGLSIAVPLSQPELATMVGVSEATVQTVLRKLRQERVIRTGYRHLTVLDLAALEALRGS